MKKIYLLLAVLFFFKTGYSQLTYEYPFKTCLDSENNLYATGYTIDNNQYEIILQKFNQNFETLINEIYLNTDGNDRGMDLIVDPNGNIYLTGFKFKNYNQQNEIITLKYDKFGILFWDSTFNNIGDDKGYGIDIISDISGNANEIYVSGYKTNSYNQKTFFVQRLNSYGNIIWQKEISVSGKYDIATDIKVDAGNVYVTGYSYQGRTYGDDVMIVTLDKESGDYSPNDVLIQNVAGSHEKPTAFIITNYSRVPISKSRSSVTSISESFELNPRHETKFSTVFYDEDVDQKLHIKWATEFYNYGNNKHNVPTAMTSDVYENVYVTGYTTGERTGADLDFVTMVYKNETGELGWNNRVIYYNNDSLQSPTYNDKASSIKLGDSGVVYVAGTSDASPFGYSLISYKQESVNSPPIKKWTKTFIPLFEIENGPVETPSERAALIEVDSEGQPILIAMEWNANGAEWKARKYDTDGNVLFTTGEEDNSDENSIVNLNLKEKITEENNISETQLFQNKPNPFNPATDISFNIAANGFVTLKVYNMLGQEAAVLVNEMKQPGTYKFRFDGSALASGMYFYKLFVNDKVADSKRMLLLK